MVARRLLLSVNNGGAKQNWWNPRSQTPSQSIISLSVLNSLDPHFAQNICHTKCRVSIHMSKSQITDHTTMERLSSPLGMNKILSKGHHTSSLSISPSESNKDSGSLPSAHNVSRCWNRSLIFNFRLSISDLARWSSFSGFNLSMLHNYHTVKQLDKNYFIT